MVGFSEEPQPATAPVATTAAAPVPTTPSVDSAAILRAKTDSLRNALDTMVYPAKLQKAWNQCHERKLAIIAKGRKARDFAHVDSILHASRAANIPPSTPEIQRLMGEKFVMQRKMEERYQASPEGKHCLMIENKRKHLMDSAVAAHLAPK